MALAQVLKCCSLICGKFCLKGDLSGVPPWLPCVYVARSPGVNKPSSILEKEMATHSSILARKNPIAPFEGFDECYRNFCLSGILKLVRGPKLRIPALLG